MIGVFTPYEAVGNNLSFLYKIYQFILININGMPNHLFPDARTSLHTTEVART